MACSRDARLMFIGIWNFVDDAGRCPNSERTIKAQVFPGDEDISALNVRRWIDELSTNGLVSIYVVNGKSFLQVTGWHHQKIDKPRASKHPGPFDDHSTNDRRGLATDLNYLNYLNRSYPIKDPILEREGSRKIGGEGVKHPKHGAISKDKLFVYLKRGTPEFEAYSKDYREAKGDDASSTGDGRWFKWAGEQAIQ
jgi:hypothetical protein